MLGYLVEKEFKQIFRDKLLPKIILLFPFMTLILLPYAANFEVKDMRLVIVDEDNSTYSKELVGKLIANNSINLVASEHTYNAALGLIQNDKADMVINIPKNFEKDFVVDKKSKILIAVNSVNGTKGTMGGMYALSIIKQYQDEKTTEITGINDPPGVEIKTIYQFNRELDYKFFMVPALMVMVLTIVSGFLPAFNIVGEKEKGNMEQINVSPVTKPIFILSKLIPYWVIGMVIITIGFIVARLFYNIVPQGSLLTIYLFSFVFTLAVSGMGLILSNYANTYQQVVFMMFFFIMILILMSGLYTPFNSMPPWAQKIGAFSPLTYFIEVMRNVYLKGSQLTDLLPQLYKLLGFVVVINSWAILSYRKKS
ncbi:MAG: ABC transporter permease [Bacteroidales bacterium]|nr:ABC transporter permease [Bacteroidales bacterium]